MLWDTADKERLSAIISSYIRGCLGFVIGHDITDRSSLEDTSNKNMCPYATVVVIENKLGSEGFREDPLKRVKLWQETYMCPFSLRVNTQVSQQYCQLQTLLSYYYFFLVFAKTGTNVDRAMETLVDKILETIGD